jgi:prevent-host-death family protein
METVTVSELNQQTARVLDRIKAGEMLEISEYGKPIARLVPVMPMTGSSLLDQLVAQGRAIPASAPGPIPATPPRGEAEDGTSLTDVLAQMRADEQY